jgi:hypothetical protein
MPVLAFFSYEQRRAPELFWKPDYQRAPNGREKEMRAIMRPS